MGAKCWLAISLKHATGFHQLRGKNKVEVDVRCILVFFFVI
jgi:hypothetical protein